MDPDEFELAAEDIESDIERVSEHHSPRRRRTRKGATKARAGA